MKSSSTDSLALDKRGKTGRSIIETVLEQDEPASPNKLKPRVIHSRQHLPVLPPNAFTSGEVLLTDQLLSADSQEPARVIPENLMSTASRGVSPMSSIDDHKSSLLIENDVYERKGPQLTKNARQLKQVVNQVDSFKRMVNTKKTREPRLIEIYMSQLASNSGG